MLWSPISLFTTLLWLHSFDAPYFLSYYYRGLNLRACGNAPDEIVWHRMALAAFLWSLSPFCPSLNVAPFLSPDFYIYIAQFINSLTKLHSFCIICSLITLFCLWCSYCCSCLPSSCSALVVALILQDVSLFFVTTISPVSATFAKNLYFGFYHVANFNC